MVAGRGRVTVTTLVLAGGFLAGCTTTVGDPVVEGVETAAEGAATDVADPDALVAAMVAAMEATDLDGLVDLSVGPAQAFFVHLRHFQAATAEEDPPFPNLSAEIEGPAEVDGDVATIEGLIGYGTAEGAPPRVLTDLRMVATDDGWRLAGFTRNGHPIEEWTVPGDPDRQVTNGGISVAVVALFIDAGCFTGSDTGCPAAHRDSFGVDLEVLNTTDAPITPAPVTLPDGSEVPAWVETSEGPEPVVSAHAPGFPAGTTAEVTAVFQGASAMADGGTLYVAFETEDGTVVPIEVPVPAYPHPW
jgi:hypothetical protein